MGITPEQIISLKNKTLSKINNIPDLTNGSSPNFFSGNTSQSNNTTVLPSEFTSTNSSVASKLNASNPQQSNLLTSTGGTLQGPGSTTTPETSTVITGTNRASIEPTSSSEAQNKQNINEFMGSGNPALAATESKPAGSVNSVPNPLTEFASYNCILGLGVLTRESVSNPVDTYRKTGADFTILKSGGGGINEKRVTTVFDNEDGNLEYFIDNFSMSSVIAPNNKTGMSIGTRISFQVHEPYSMGIFLQSLKIAASKANYRNYVDAAFLLEIDFKGWTTEGKEAPVGYSSKKIPIKITNIDFDVSQGGTTYEVQAYPWNLQSLDDTVQRINDPVSIKGSSVADALSFGDQSLTAILNGKLQEIAEANNLPSTDLYVIRFPKARTTEGNTGAGSVTEAGATINPDSEKSNVLYTGKFLERTDAYFGTSPTSNSGIYQKLTAAATTDINSIGSSLVVDDFNQGTGHPFPLGLNTYDKSGNIYRRDGIELSLEDGERMFKFPQGMTIQKIIEEMVLLSGYATHALNNVDASGMRTWFMIETECHVLEDSKFENATGTSPRVFVYNVVPYSVHAGDTLPPSKAASGHKNLALQVSKEYDYLYSGNNDDILSFDLKFNTAFYTALRADYGNFSGSDVSGAKDKAVELGSNLECTIDTASGDLDELITKNRPISDISVSTGGAEYTDPRRNLAKQFHNIILNDGVDLITADVEILGDPYYLPDSGLGNYTASNSGQTATMNADGSIDYQRNEIDILIHFRTPVDYNKQGGTSFQSDTIPVEGFSGFYKVTTVESVISGNKFTQTLKLVRRKNQSMSGVSTSPLLKESLNKLNHNATLE